METLSLFAILTSLSSSLAFASALDTQPLQTVKNSISAKLDSLGYTSQEGALYLAGKSQCPDLLSIYGNCFGSNPAAPYLVPALPLHPLEHGYHHSPSVPGIPSGSGLNYRLNPDEGVLIFGNTGPKAAYFGIQNYLFSRQGTRTVPLLVNLITSLKNILFDDLLGTSRFTLFASTGNALNNQVLARNLSAASGFEQRFYYLSTADKILDTLLRSSLSQLGASPTRVYTEGIPIEVRLGLTEEADDLAILIRYALGENEAVSNAWRTSPTLKVIRITRKIPKSTIDRFGPIQLDPKTGGSESHLSVAHAVLVNEIRNRLRLSLADISNYTSMASIPVSIPPLKLVGKDCIANQMNCLGDTQDTDTYRVAGMTPLLNNEVWITVGVNHTQTGNATYINLGAMNGENMAGALNVNQTGAAAGFVQGVLNGSAEHFLKSLSPHTVPLSLRALIGKFYVAVFSRNCSGIPLCTQVASTDVPLSDSITLIQRAYIKQGTSRGADPALLRNPILLRWSR